MNIFEEDKKIVKNYELSQRAVYDLEEKRRCQWARFTAKILQYEYFVFGKYNFPEPIYFSKKIWIDFPYSNWPTFYKKESLFKRPKSIAQFRYSLDYYHWGSVSSEDDIRRYMHDLDFLVKEIDYYYKPKTNPTPAFQYSVSTEFEVLAQEFWTEMKIRVENAMDKQIAKNDINKYLIFDEELI